MDGLFFGADHRTRTHLTAICQWHIAATSSKTGGNLTMLSAQADSIGNRVRLPMYAG